MPIGLLELVLIQIGLTILMRMLAPRQKRPKAAPFESPRVELGAVIPKSFGIQQVSGIVTMSRLQDRTIHTINDAPWYNAKMQMVLGYGPGDVLYDIISDERSVFLAKPAKHQSHPPGSHPAIISPPLPIDLTGDGPQAINLAVRRLFGGDGGLHGEIRLYRGTDNQPVDPLISFAQGEDASAYPHVMHVCFGTDPADPTAFVEDSDQFTWVANTPVPKPISFVIGCYPRNLLPATDGRVGKDANGVEVIYEILTNKVWGRGWDPSRFNLASWIAAAQACLDGGLGGVSFTVADARDTADIIDDIKDHINAEVVCNPLTGLLECTLLRPDYTMGSLLTLTKKNTQNFKQLETNFSRTINDVQVKFRRFDIAGLPEVVVDRVAFDPFPNFFAIPPVFDTGSHNLIDASASRLRGGVITPLVFGVDYGYNLAQGFFVFIGGINIDPGNDTILVSYTAEPFLSGFVDDVVTAQNLANRQIIGVTNSESYDYPMYTNSVTAQLKANFLRELLSRGLPAFTWEMNREGSHLKQGDVVKVDEAVYLLTNKAIRIIRVGYGTLDRPTLSFEGVEDLWGEAVSLNSLNFDSAFITPPITDTAPSMAAIFCLQPSAIRIGFQAGDVLYNIEIERSDDAIGTGAVIITPADGIVGSSTFFDDVQTVGTTKWYRARQIRAGANPGPWSDTISCVATAGVPPDSACVLPTFQDIPTVVDTDAILTVAITDPQNRVVLVEFKSQSGGLGETAYTTVANAPYIFSVPLIGIFPTIITRRITFVDCNGDPQIDEQSSALTVPVIAPPDPFPTALQAVLFDIALHSGASVPWGIEDVAAAITPLSALRTSTRKFDLSTVKAVRIAATIIETTLPVGAKIGVQGQKFDETWDWLDEVGGPFLAVDPDSLGDDDDLITAGDYVDLAGWAQTDLRLRAVSVGGDGTGRLIVGEIALQPRSQADGLPTPPEGGIGTPENPTGGEGPGGECGGETGELLFSEPWTYVDRPAMLDLWLPTSSDVSGGGFGGTAGSTGVTTTYVGVANAGYARYTRIVNLPSAIGASVIVSCRMTRDVVQTGFDDHSGISVDGLEDSGLGTELDKCYQVTITVPPSGNLAIQIGQLLTRGGPYTITFFPLTVRRVGGGGTGGGGGGGGNDPVPPPVPYTGGRLYGAFSIPTTGAGPWNATIKSLRPSWVSSLLNQARDNGIHLFVEPAGGPEPVSYSPGWTNSDGTFNLNMWKARILEMAGNSDIAAAIADGTIVAHYMIDEPYSPGTWGGQRVPSATIDEMARFSHSIWPTMPTFIRATIFGDPGFNWQHLDGFWAQWRDYLGSAANFLAANVAACQAKNKLLVVGMNIFTGSSDDFPGGRMLDANEFRTYGNILAASSFPVAFMIWEYQAAWYNQTGMAAAVTEVAATFKANDP